MNPPSRSSVLSPEIHELIGLIYDSVADQQGFFPFLRRFVEVFQGYSASFAIYNIRTNALVGAWTVDIPDDALAFYSEHVSHRDVLVETALQVKRDGELRFVASNLDLGPDTERLREETRAGEWLASYGASEAAGAIAYLDGTYLNFFGMQRSAEQPPFTREELSVFDQFLPHISRAVGLYTRLSHQNFQPVAERLALERVNRGILVCDAAFRVVFSNATADAIIGRGAGLRLAGDRTLIAQGTGRAREFSVLLTGAVGDSINERDGPDRLFQLQHGGHRITVVITPLLGDGAGSGQGKGALITLYDWSAQPEVNPELVRMTFGLTGAESQVALQLMEGLSLAEIAELSGRSRETVKYHLNSLFRKTGTRRQGALISLLSRSVAAG